MKFCASPPPPGFSNEFVYFAAKLDTCEAIALAVVRCFHLCLVFSPAIEFWALQMLMKHMRIGGVVPSFDSSLDTGAFYSIYMSSLVRGLLGAAAST
jgi:hypothetical protein